MATARQIAANQRNAQKSTGPRTPEGKARSARNSTTHGLRSAQLCLLASEDPAEYESFAESFHLHYAPQTPPEHRYLAQLISAAWKLDRLARMETGLFDQALLRIQKHNPALPSHAKLQADPSQLGPMLNLAVQQEDTGQEWTRYQRYQQALERSFARAEAALNRLAKLPLAEPEVTEPNEANSPVTTESNEPNSPATLNSRPTTQSSLPPEPNKPNSSLPATQSLLLPPASPFPFGRHQPLSWREAYNRAVRLGEQQGKDAKQTQSEPDAA